MLTLILALISLSSGQLVDCDSDFPGPYKVIPKTIGQVKPAESFVYKGRCFGKISVAVSESEKSFDVEILAYDKRSTFCTEFSVLSSGKSHALKTYLLQGSYAHSFAKKDMSEHEAEFIRSSGLYLMKSCLDVSDFPRSLFETAKLFVGGLGTNPLIPIFGSKVPEYQLSANIDFVKRYTGYQFERWPKPQRVNIDKKNIRSGDFLAILRLDGIDQLIHWGSGSRIGHSTMALWRDGELYVVESQDGPYWPRRGIQKNKFDQWAIWADNADFNVLHVPLSDEARAKFDVEKAWAFYDSMEGFNYGYHNFLFGFWDTPSENVQGQYDLISLSIITSIFGQVVPKVIDMMFLDAINKRLGTEKLNFAGVWEELYRRKTTLGEIMSIPERDDWRYEDGPNYVCSSFLVAVYKAGGLFGGLDVQATEFTPKDLLELNIWETSGKYLGAECRDFAVEHRWCQIMGKVKMNLGPASFVEPYDQMNERCPSIAPDYKRVAGC